MRNLTITIDEEVARWARMRAATEGTSVSRLVGRLLREHMAQEHSYRAAMKRDLARGPLPLKSAGTYPARDEIYDRPVLRGH